MHQIAEITHVLSKSVWIIIGTIMYIGAALVFSLLGVFTRTRTMITIGEDREDRFFLLMRDMQRAKLTRRI